MSAGGSEPVWDVCIVGAGPAGLSVASQLIDSGLRVCVIEAGSATPALDRFPPVECAGEDPYPSPGGGIATTHAAMVGGTVGLWSAELPSADGRGGLDPERGCRYAPLDPWDLVADDELDRPGWPIEACDLDRWYAAAQVMCGLGPFDYTAEHWSRGDTDRPLPLPRDAVVTSMFQFGSQAAWTVRARASLEAAGIVLMTDTDALWLEPDRSERRVVGVTVHGPGGSRVVAARQVVLAAGGLETTRLLLDTGRRHHRTPGNHAGLVGRFFMEHPLVRGGLLITEPGDRMIDRLSLYATRLVAGTVVSAKLTLAPDLIINEHLLGCSALLTPRDVSYGSGGALALARLRSPSGRRDHSVARAGNALRVVAGAAGVARAVRAGRSQPNIDKANWAEGRGLRSPSRFSVFEVLHQTEQRPDPANRLTLHEHTDALGRSGMRLSWHWSSQDQANIMRSRDHFARVFADQRIGRMVNTDWDDGRPRMLTGTHHHMGTTRMSADPEEGVVDPHGRVHHWDNLHIASSSTFPSAGFVNPTLTVVALALRLGDRLRALPH